MRNTAYEQGKAAYKQWLAMLEVKADSLLLDAEILKPRRLERSKYLAFEFLDYVKTMLSKKRAHLRLRTVARQSRPVPPPDCTRWGWSSETATPKTQCIGWYDAETDAVYLLPEETTEAVNYHLQFKFRYFGKSVTTVGIRLRNAGITTTQDKHRVTTRRMVDGKKHKVWVIPAALFFDD